MLDFEIIEKEFNSDQPRDDAGRWASAGGGGASAAAEVSAPRIHVTGQNPFTGSDHEFGLLKDGMTLPEFNTAFKNAHPGQNAAATLRRAQRLGLISVERPEGSKPPTPTPDTKTPSAAKAPAPASSPTKEEGLGAKISAEHTAFTERQMEEGKTTWNALDLGQKLKAYDTAKTQMDDATVKIQQAWVD